MKRMIVCCIVAGFISGLGCVNIPSKFEAHITVDIRHHIEQQAANTLDYIEGKTDELAMPPAPAVKPVSRLEALWEFLSPVGVAYAAELKDTSPLVTEIATQLRQRNSEVQALKDSGVAGEDNRGYLALRNPGKVTGANGVNEVQRLVAAENKDRKALYQEVARLNKDQDVNVGMVERVYAMQRLQRAKPGELFQLPPKGDEFDAFKKSSAGQRLGAEAQPDAWVVIK